LNFDYRKLREVLSLRARPPAATYQRPHPFSPPP
jgi:hypothetical protein